MLGSDPVRLPADRDLRSEFRRRRPLPRGLLRSPPDAPRNELPTWAGGNRAEPPARRGISSMTGAGVLVGSWTPVADPQQVEAPGAG